jgi:hypothetical protein
MSSPEFENFEYLFIKAEKLLALRKGGEIVKRFRDMAPYLAQYLDDKQPPPMSELLDSFVKKFFGMGLDALSVTLDVALCESALVLGVTALEVYLRDVYKHKLKKECKRLLETIPRLEEWSNATGINPFKLISSDKLNQVLQWRHVIAHSGGMVDRVAIDGKLMGVVEGDQARDKLTPDYTSNLLGMIKSVAESVEKQYFHP